MIKEKDIIKIVKRYCCNCSNKVFDITEGIPTEAPKKKDAKVLLDIETGLMWYWNGEEWNY